MTKIKGIVNGCTDPKEFHGKMQVGFTLVDASSKWYNIEGTQEHLYGLKGTTLNKGHAIEFDLEGSKVSNLKIDNAVEVVKPQDFGKGGRKEFDKDPIGLATDLCITLIATNDEEKINPSDSMTIACNLIKQAQKAFE